MMKEVVVGQNVASKVILRHGNQLNDVLIIGMV